jgi:hypothetical protein
MSNKSFYILLDMPGDNILGMGTLTDAELHSKVSELLAVQARSHGLRCGDGHRAACLCVL